MDPVPRDCILVVDDEEIHEIFEHILRKEGYCEISYMDPESALEYFRINHRKLSLAIVDSTMQKMTGIELSHLFLEIDAQVPIILTSDTMEIPPEASRLPNVKTFLVKPVTNLEFLHAVKISMIKPQ